MTREDLGSLAWGERGGGVLTRPEAIRFALRSLGQAMTFIGSRTVQSLSLHCDAASVPLSAMDTPRSPLGRAVEGLVATQPASIQHHLRRTVAFASAIDRHQRMAFPDRDLLWSACMLHDIGLENPVENQCFAVRGGLLARTLASNCGESRAWAEALGEAVSRHATPLLNRRRQPLAYLVAAGALADILGLHLQHLDPHFVRDVVRAQPRAHFSTALSAAWRREAAAAPRGRAAAADRFGFSCLAHYPPAVLQ